MKTLSILILSVLCSALLQAQDAGTNISSGLTTGKYRPPYKRDLSLFSNSGTAPAQSMLRDTVLYNMYGQLREDNPEYNPKSPLWLCGLRVVLNNAVTWATDRYVFNADYARIGTDTWNHNIQTGWEWDTDRFGMNFFFHPYSGSGYLNAGRSNGYSFYESVPFALGGSLMWEYFGENTLPSYNDLINTTITGAFLGEISYRLSSDFLDDRATGSERFFRELFSAAISPTRAFTRLTHGKLFRVSPQDNYQKEPLNMTFAAGERLINDNRTFGTGSNNTMLNLQLDYGNPFEVRSRKSFDYFELRADLTFGAGRKIIDNVVGHGLLFGGNFQSGNMEMLIGGFQHYDFWDNRTFELGTVAFGGGMISRLPVSANSNLDLTAHLGIVPLAGNSSRLVTDTSEFRDYNYGYGAEGKLEAHLDLGGWTSLEVRTYYYWIRTYVGIAGDNFIGMFKPSVTFRVVDNLSLGFEQVVYYSDRYPRDFPFVHDVQTEQRVFVQFHIENIKQ